MIIVNADDWGGWQSATDAALASFEAGQISSVSAMVFMADSQRGAALSAQKQVPTGLHLNLNQDFSSPDCPSEVQKQHRRIHRFLKWGRYALLIYNPMLRKAFRQVVEAQYQEFLRLYGRKPTHIDGHRHMHLCSNILLGDLLPKSIPVRRSFSFWPGEKSVVNRMYRQAVDRRLTRSHRTTHYFFALSQCMSGPRFERVISLSNSHPVELMTHPEMPKENAFLKSEQFVSNLRKLKVGNYAEI